MRLNVRLKRYLKKFLYLLPVVITIFCCIFAVPVQAVEYAITMPISQPNVAENFGYIEVVTKYGDNDPVGWVFLVSFYNLNQDNEIQPYCYLTIQNSTSATGSSALRFAEGSLTGDYTFFSIVVLDDEGNFFNKGNSQSTGVITSTFTGQIISIRPYGPFEYNNLSANNTSSVSFSYGNDNVSNALLASLVTILQSNNSDVIENANQNAQDIQDNANQNAQDIQDNADKNTSTITDGWETDQSAEIEGQDEYQEKESQLIDDVTSGSEESRQEVSDGFFASIVRGFTGLNAISVMYADFLENEVIDLGGLVYFSLGLGIVPLIAGATINVLRRNK